MAWLPIVIIIGIVFIALWRKKFSHNKIKRNQKTSAKKKKALPKQMGADTRLDDFISELKKQVKSSGLNTQNLKNNTMSDGTVNFMYKDWQIGRVYFGKRVSRMQIIDDDTVEWLNGKSFDEYISYIPKWIEYARHLEDTEDFLKDFTGKL